MKWLRRGVALVVVLLLMLPLSGPVAAAGEVYFTAVNDSMLDLSLDPMPLWSGGTLYVPYTVFDGNNSTRVDIGISSSYNRDSGVLALYGSLQQALAFDLKQGVAYNGLTEQTLSGKAILRNGIPYVPVATVCQFFGLTYSTISISAGYIVRIKTASVVLSDTKFVDAASNYINSQLREYNQANQSAPTPGVLPPTTEEGSQPPPISQPPEDEDSTYVCLGIRCDDTQGLEEILNTLDGQHRKAVFFFPKEQLEREDALLYRILASGHTLGLLAEGSTAAATRAMLEEGNQLLRSLTYTTTQVALVPRQQVGVLEEAGWICWQESASAIPQPGEGALSHANKVLRALDGKEWQVYVTLDGGQESARILPTLMMQMGSKSYYIMIPREDQL